MSRAVSDVTASRAGARAVAAGASSLLLLHGGKLGSKGAVVCWQKGLRNPSQREMAKQSATRVTHMREMRSGWLLGQTHGWQNAPLRISRYDKGTCHTFCHPQYVGEITRSDQIYCGTSISAAMGTPHALALTWPDIRPTFDHGPNACPGFDRHATAAFQRRRKALFDPLTKAWPMVGRYCIGGRRYDPCWTPV